MPEYAENVNVHTTGAFCKCREGLAQETRHDDAGCTPSKVVKLSAEPIESPSDKLSAREVKARTPSRKESLFMENDGSVIEGRS